MESYGESQCHLEGGESVWRKNHHNNSKCKEEVSNLSLPLITMNILFLPLWFIHVQINDLPADGLFWLDCCWVFPMKFNWLYFLEV